jgi:hypothetical protein
MGRLITLIHKINESTRFKAIVKFAENAGKLVIVITAINWLIEAPQRKQLKDAAAWSVVNTASGSRADGGRSTQLRLLNDDGMSLAGIYPRGAHLPELRLTGADLRDANFAETDIRDADFSCRRVYFFCLDAPI